MPPPTSETGHEKMNLSKTAAAFGVAALLLTACGDDATPEAVETTPEAVETETTPEVVETEPTGDASVSFTNVADGDTITTSFVAEFAATGVTVAPAGEVVEGEGHFHIIIDAPCVAAGETIPADDAHLHFGDASTSATLELEVGEHTLCLQLGDGAHTATDLTQQITVTVA